MLIVMKIKEMPFYNRPGVRLQRKGPSSLSDAELLAVILGRGDFSENAVDQANRVLAKYNFHRLSDLSFNELDKEFKNNVKAMKILAMFEIFQRMNKLTKGGFKWKIKTAEDIYKYFIDEYQEKKKEYFLALFLNTKNQIIKDEVISVGTLNASLITAREVFNAAIRACSNTIVLVHNHPSGDCTPSKEDEEVTKTLDKAGNLLAIKVLDHVIIGKDGYTSMRENGLF